MSKQGCKTLRKMFVFMALFPPPLRTSSSSFLPPLPAPTSALDHPPPPCLVLSRLLAKSSSLFLFYFLLPPVFQNARGRSYFSCFSLLLSLLRGVTPPRVFPRLASPSPMSFYVVYSTLPSASIPTPNNLSPLLSIDSPAGVPPTFAAPL